MKRFWIEKLQILLLGFYQIKKEGWFPPLFLNHF